MILTFEDLIINLFVKIDDFHKNISPLINKCYIECSNYNENIKITLENIKKDITEIKKDVIDIWKDVKVINDGITGLIKEIKENNKVEVA